MVNGIKSAPVSLISGFRRHGPRTGTVLFVEQASIVICFILRIGSMEYYVRSLIKMEFAPDGGIPCIINHLTFPSKQIPQDRASKVTIKNSVYFRFIRTWAK